ncbi:MAG: hypothetical protein ACXW65_20935 [Gemmatirosa sp.]
MSTPGLGDRWLRGERLPDVAFALHDRVVITGGSRDGQFGTVVLLLAVSPHPLYLVSLAGGGGDLKVRQSSLRAAD